MNSGKCSHEVPMGKSPPKGSKQSSGKTKHGRMTVAGKVENLNNFKK